MVTYEQQLSRNLPWALKEGSMHFEKESAVHKALHKITKRLGELGIPYAVVGGMAMFFHGYRRFTEDVDLLVTPEHLREIHRQLEGLGYVPPFSGSKHLRDTDSGVRIEFLTTGDYPGDGLPKAVSFPHPDTCSVELNGMRVLGLAGLVELKLASGMSNPRRGKDLVDVQEMIERLDLPEALAEEIDPSVRDKYLEIWRLAHSHPA